MRSSIHKKAKDEIIDGARFYRERDPAVASRFIRRIEEAKSRIERSPSSFPLIDEEHRRMLVPGFPYSIIFKVAGGELRIIAVAHQSREILYWRDRS
jgi:toxin ParE1/3/4